MSAASTCVHVLLRGVSEHQINEHAGLDKGGEVRLGLVASPNELGAWGRTDPLLLFHDIASGAYTGTAFLPAETLQLACLPTHNSLLSLTLPCRLVLLASQSSSTAVLPTWEIVAVDDIESTPRSLLIEWQPGTDTACTATMDLSSAAVIHFASAAEHFPSLHALRHNSPVLSLTMYQNDPTVAYSHRTLQSRHHYRTTTLPFSVVAVQPVPLTGSCWSDDRLPVAAPLWKKAKTGKEAHKSCIDSVACTTGGWCVRGLHSASPVSVAGCPYIDSDVTQQCWHCLLSLREMEGHALEIALETDITVLVGGGGHEMVKAMGKTVMTAAMLKQNTRGTLALPVQCSFASHSAWVMLHVQYLVSFPYSNGRNDLSYIRSRASHQNQLTLQTLAGHRGLGKTYTCGWKRGAAGKAKLAENSVESFIAAHHRGDQMVEFDVMLTRDGVPVVIHDPIVQLYAKVGARKRCAELGAGASLPIVDTPLSDVHADRAIPVPVAVCNMTRDQLEGIVARTFDPCGPPPRLKRLMLSHWEDILLLSRSQLGAHGGEPACTTSLTKGKRGRKPEKTSHAATAAALKPSHGSRLLHRQENITNHLPTLHELFSRIPADLRVNLEVKYPFMPQYDANLFLQTDVFEVNGFVDAILDVVFAHAPRQVAFSSFDPDICIALATKQSRYHVLFLSDTEERFDLKDYRSFYIEGAIQFATLHRLAGVSINSGTLCGENEERQKTFPLHATIPSNALRNTAQQTPVATELYTFSEEQNKAEEEKQDGKGSLSYTEFDCAPGAAIVAEAHRRGLKVWTWSERNGDLYFSYLQAARMGVDAIITDNTPLPAAPAHQ